MGSSESKDSKFLDRFSAEEKERITNFFKDFPDKCVDKTALKVLVEDSLPERLTEQIYSLLGTPDIKYRTFVHFLSVVLKGSNEEKKEMLLDLMTAGRETILFRNLSEFLSDTASALFQQLVSQTETSQICKNWKFKFNEVIQRRLRKLFVLDLCPKDCGTIEDFSISKDILRHNLKESSLTFQVLCMVYHNAFLKLHQGSKSLTVKLPSCSEERYVAPYLDLPTVLLLNHSLPPELQSEWRLLYSSEIHGEGFSTMLNRVISRGPSLVFIKDKGDAVFGGFADCSWKIKPCFSGGANCFVFTLFPKMARYLSTGYNSNYMYLCQNQMTLPNGIGFGGQLNHFGLWLDDDFRKGHSTPACATFQSKQLSSDREYQLDSIEIWGVGPPVEPEKPTDRTSILDKDMTTKAMLMVADKIGASDGIREEDSRIEREKALI